MAPILGNKDHQSASVFEPAALLRQARRQKGLALETVPRVCVLDPDGDIVRRLLRDGVAERAAGWPCYHTDLYTFALAGIRVGIVGRAVGAPFAVLVAEELFASGCQLLVSITSAGQIHPAGALPYFVIIDRALRDEGTSDHYAAAADYAVADAIVVAAASEAARRTDLGVAVGASWTTDAPFRETATAVDAARRSGILAVEMEAAALYSLAQAKRLRVLCIAHVTNTMGLAAEDFEKGEADGTADALALLAAVVPALLPAVHGSPGA
jgi:uridine phosphorylase